MQNYNFTKNIFNCEDIHFTDFKSMFKFLENTSFDKEFSVNFEVLEFSVNFEIQKFTGIFSRKNNAIKFDFDYIHNDYMEQRSIFNNIIQTIYNHEFSDRYIFCDYSEITVIISDITFKIYPSNRCGLNNIEIIDKRPIPLRECANYQVFLKKYIFNKFLYNSRNLLVYRELCDKGFDISKFILDVRDYKNNFTISENGFSGEITEDVSFVINDGGNYPEIADIYISSIKPVFEKLLENIENFDCNNLDTVLRFLKFNVLMELIYGEDLLFKVRDLVSNNIYVQSIISKIVPYKKSLRVSNNKLISRNTIFYNRPNIKISEILDFLPKVSDKIFDTVEFKVIFDNGCFIKLPEENGKHFNRFELDEFDFTVFKYIADNFVKNENSFVNSKNFIIVSNISNEEMIFNDDGTFYILNPFNNDSVFDKYIDNISKHSGYTYIKK